VQSELRERNREVSPAQQVLILIGVNLVEVIDDCGEIYMVQASLAADYAMNGEQRKAQQTLARLLELRSDYALATKNR
jgi:hypothetical protein